MTCYMENLRREVQWDREWRIVWEAWRNHVRRALFAFFKGQVIENRKQIYVQVYMLELACWLAAEP